MNHLTTDLIEALAKKQDIKKFFVTIWKQLSISC